MDYSETLSMVLGIAERYALGYQAEYITIDQLVVGIIEQRKAVLNEAEEIGKSTRAKDLVAIIPDVFKALQDEERLEEVITRVKKIWRAQNQHLWLEKEYNPNVLQTSQGVKYLLHDAVLISLQISDNHASVLSVIYLLMAGESRICEIGRKLLNLRKISSSFKLETTHDSYPMTPVKGLKAHIQLVAGGEAPQDIKDIFAAIVSNSAERLRHITDSMPWEGSLGKENKTTKLSKYCRELVQEARDKKLDPLVGRKEELDRLIQVLLRRKKNNPVLIGDPGVGKTAIVEGLANAIVNQEVPETLNCQELYMLDITSLVAGTRYRGEFEDRMIKLVKELEERPEAVLFLDEIHTVWGAGGNSDGAMDASSILKPYFASGQLRFIGTTTYENYRSTLMKDHALSRRLQTIDVPELAFEQTVEVLEGLKEKYERHHKVSFTTEALKETAKLAARHIQEPANPDKSVDILDEAGSMHSAFPDRFESDIIDVDEIRSVVAKIARIPDLNTVADDTEMLRGLESALKEAVYGQDEAVETVVSAVKLSRAGLKHPERPICNFLFAGPTGVGKTELAKQLAAKLNIKFLRFDMSEHADKTSVSRLIGADPGYIGYESGGQLTNAIIKNPHAVLLLDEIEKAHPSIFNILLQVMDAARLTDNTGREASFRNVILIMTSNVGARGFDQTRVGFDSTISNEWDERELKKTFAPEFRNRLDSIVTFKPLPREIVTQIVDKFIVEMEFQLAEKNIKFKLTDEAREYFADQGYDKKFGARPLERVLRDKIKRPLADEILFGKLVKGGVVKVSLDGEEVKFSIKAHRK